MNHKKGLLRSLWVDWGSCKGYSRGSASYLEQGFGVDGRTKKPYTYCIEYTSL